jgi:chromosome segregation ATPase
LQAFMEQMNLQFSELSSNVNKLAEGMNRVEARLDNIEVRLDKVETRLDNIELRLDKLEERQDKVELTLQHVGSEFRSHFVKIENELEQNRDMFKIYAADLHHLKTDVEFLSAKTGIHDTKLNNIEKRLEV